MFRLFRRSRRADGGTHDDGNPRPGGGSVRQEPDGPVPPAAAPAADHADAGAGAAAPAAIGADPTRHVPPDGAGWPAGAAAGTHDPAATTPDASAGSLPPAPPAPPAPPPGMPADDARPPPRGIALDEIARGMQHAAAAANQLLAHQYTAVLDQFFDLRDDGLLAPREVTVALDAEHTMPVPLVALATPRGLALDRMVVHLTVRADFTEALPAGGLAGGDQRGRFFVTLAPPSARKDAEGRQAQRDTQHIDIEMQFTALAPPEAIMRVIDEYTHRLVPRKRHDEPEKPHD